MLNSPRNSEPTETEIGHKNSEPTETVEIDAATLKLRSTELALWCEALLKQILRQSVKSDHAVL